LILSTRSFKDFVEVKVSDHGMGIPQKYLGQIFDPFFTTKEVGKGTGLGLSTSIAIVKSHGGFINVYSEEKNGTTFTIYFPAHSTGDAIRSIQQLAELPAGNGETVLVVDDEASIREITRSTLETYGFKVMTASDGTEALSIYAQHKDEIAAVIMDMMMPNLDGLATIRVLRKMDPHMKIIPMSGLVADKLMVDSLGIKKELFLQKPYTAEKLLVTLNRVLTEKAE
jgi:CheY-like chemotaxis protein